MGLIDNSKNLSCCHFCRNWDQQSYLSGRCVLRNRKTIHFQSCEQYETYLTNCATTCLVEDSEHWRKDVIWKDCEECNFYVMCWDEEFKSE